MPGGRPITGSDLVAALRSLAGNDRAAERLAARVGPGERFLTLDAVAAACPPEALGLPRGAFMAILGPLFGEFE